MALPFSAITDFLFGNIQKDILHGLEIWTDESIASPPGEPTSANTYVRIQVVPQNIQFAQKARISEQVIKDGRAFFFWRKDRTSNHLDLLELNLSGITRSLAKEPGKKSSSFLSTLASGALSEIQQGVPLVGSLASLAQSAPPPQKSLTPKQREWLKLWNITRSRYVTETGINEHHIRLLTPALPWEGSNGIEFVGHFTGPIQFSEVADNLFLVQWQFGLIVHYTNPSLDQLLRSSDPTNIANDARKIDEPTPPTSTEDAANAGAPLGPLTGLPGGITDEPLAGTAGQGSVTTEIIT